MAKQEKRYAIRFDGSDADYLWFSTPSWSTRGRRYDITIDKRTGETKCSCADCVYRIKKAHLVDMLTKENVRQCKHCARLLAEYKEILELPED